ncbi:hypothetical protein SPRG_10631 [Saprolegnia parasitica CBS 223.65]|uniref:FHA domain-containing protein n=1 Tax=Saprolegnia parasitica (strain CBS 223.65) TaxID=695850 RepID=A0A067CBP6_SAPPC|nr:hypothetical protein SPRG_10631 [Saprolegnia parasitica CBS 223.65]KDO24202.1 hypothetical protein SPRG_10631 [Saprolegnia parasitica CBS 223.65]|eukprot:XP_012205146.1 hypothetical protein SPRG_10631 [Saprolegnia parasitica CBS 223.65]
MWVLEWESEGVTLRLVQGEWTLGRKGNALNFPNDSSISRQHAKLHVGGLEHLDRIAELPSFTLVDSKSRFGTFVNGAQIKENVPVDLRVGDKISFGAKNTVLVVGYVRMVARISRIQKTNRRRLLENCKLIGMHVVANPVPEITHCLMDAGNFVATEKILWALVHAHPVVSSDWVQAVVARESLSSDLPRYEGFLPIQASQQAHATPSYLLDTRRCSLYNDFFVVFLVPTSMGPLVQAMGGVVYLAYLEPSLAHDTDLLDAVVSTKRTPLIVYPGNGTELTQTSDVMSASVRDWDPSVLRRLQLLRRRAFVMHHELVASILFTRPPLYLSDDSFDALLQQAAPPLSSFVPETTTMPPIVESSTPIEFSAVAIKPATETFLSVKMEPVPMTQLAVPETKLQAESVPTKLPLWKKPTFKARHETPPASPLPSTPNIKVQPPSPEPTPAPPRYDADPETKVADDDALLDEKPTTWMQKKNVKTPVERDDDAPPPTVVSSQLIVRKSAPAEPHARYLVRDATAPVPGVRNFKRFKKNAVPRASALITRYQSEVPVDLERKRAYEKQQEELEAQERIAEELFEMNMHRQPKRANLRFT